jgi:hypothetical protein
MPMALVSLVPMPSYGHLGVTIWKGIQEKRGDLGKRGKRGRQSKIEVDGVK